MAAIRPNIWVPRSPTYVPWRRFSGRTRGRLARLPDRPFASLPICGKTGRRGSPLTALAHGSARHLNQRADPLAQCLQPVAVAAVEQLGRVADRVTELAVVRLPPHVASPARLPGELFDVHALVEAELRVRAAQARVLDTTPGADAGAVRERVVVDPDHPRFDLVRHPLPLGAVLGPDRGAEAEL